MYKRGKTGKKDFTKNHMKAIFLFAFDVTPKSGKKADWLIQLKKSDEDDAEKILKDHWQRQWWMDQQHQNRHHHPQQQQLTPTMKIYPGSTIAALTQ